MKKIIAFSLILTILSLFSCNKKNNNVAPANNTPAGTTDSPINIQYRVTAASGNFNVTYTCLEDDKVVTKTMSVKKINFTYSFGWTTNKTLGIKASNESPSAKEVLVEIYVNGNLFKSASANTPGGVAIAEGIYN
jgi:hypothetical protein